MSDETNNKGGSAKPKPKHIYFYYLKPGSDKADHPDHFPIEVYFVSRNDDTAPDAVLVQDIIGRADRGEILPVGFSIEDLHWRYPGYLVFALKDAKHTLSAPDAVTIEYRPSDTCEPEPGPKRPAAPAHSFGDLQSITFPAGTSQGLSSVWFENLRTNKLHRPLGEKGKESETFWFAFNFGIRSKVDLTHTENGTNTGP